MAFSVSSAELASLFQMPVIVLRALHIVVHINCLCFVCLFVLTRNSSSFPCRLVLITLLSILYFACILCFSFITTNAMRLASIYLLPFRDCVVSLSPRRHLNLEERAANGDSKPLNDDITIHVYRDD